MTILSRDEIVKKYGTHIQAILPKMETMEEIREALFKVEIEEFPGKDRSSFKEDPSGIYHSLLRARTLQLRRLSELYNSSEKSIEQEKSWLSEDEIAKRPIQALHDLKRDHSCNQGGWGDEQVGDGIWFAIIGDGKGKLYMDELIEAAKADYPSYLALIDDIKNEREIKKVVKQLSTLEVDEKYGLTSSSQIFVALDDAQKGLRVLRFKPTDFTFPDDEKFKRGQPIASFQSSDEKGKMWGQLILRENQLAFQMTDQNQAKMISWGFEREEVDSKITSYLSQKFGQFAGLTGKKPVEILHDMANTTTPAPAAP